MASRRKGNLTTSEEINQKDDNTCENEGDEEETVETEEGEEEETEETEERDDIMGVVLVVIGLYLIYVVPLVMYYVPTGNKGVSFYYLTNKTSLDWNEFQTSVEGISSIPVTPETSVTFIIHGFSESSHRPWIHRLARAVLSREEGHNIVLIIDYWDLHRAEYFWMRSNTHYVAKKISNLLDNLVLHNNLQLSRTHLIGFSLGGQMCGIIGANLKTGVLGRITALDPTFPYLDWQRDEESLDADDAEMVVVLRTSAVSYFTPQGDVDFYVNGGIKQPGCDLWWYSYFVQQACSHFRPVMMALEAEKDAGKGAFPACLCSDYESFKNGSCSCEITTHFDLTTFNSPRGKFYLFTNENPPYTIPLGQGF